MIDSHGSAGDESPPEGLLESAAREVAKGAPVDSVVAWFDVPESELRAFMAERFADATVAEGSSLASVAEWFGVSEPELRALIGDGADRASVAEWFGVSEPELRALMGDDWQETEEQPGPVDATVEAAPVPSEVPEGSVDAAVENPPEPEGHQPDGPPVRKPATRPTSRRSPNVGGNIRPQPRPAAPMTLQDSVQVLRRRALLVFIAIVLGASAGWMTAPGRTAHATTYQGTHTLIYEPKDNQSYNIEQAALLATSGEVPSRVAARLHLSRSQVRSAVSAVAKSDVSTISITARNAQPVVAEALADTTAEELAVEIDGGTQAAYQTELSRLNGQVDAAQKRLAAVPAKDAAGQASARADLDAAQRALREFQGTTPPRTQLRTLENATAAAVAPAGVRAPDSKPVRSLLLGGFGLLLGVAGALAFERFDSRIRSKKAAEDAFGAPVVAEVPPIPKSSQETLLTVTQPTSPFVEAYRGLRTYVALWAPEADRDDGHRVIVVTSPAPGEGKTTTVAHLAAMLAEIGRSVVVVSADLRRPRLHQYFGRPEAPGLMNALTAPGQPVFTGLDQGTSVRGVRLVPSGPATENPAPMIEHAADLLEAVRGLADFVLVDSPPLLVASDSVELARHADGVLLVARAGKTPVEAAEHCAELLDRLDIPVVGTVLVESEAASSASRYYSSRYYAEPDRFGRRPRRSAGGNGQRPAAEARSAEASEEAPPASGQ